MQCDPEINKKIGYRSRNQIKN